MDDKAIAVPYPRGTPERLSMFSDGVFAVLITVPERWSHFVTQPAKVGSPMQRMIHHEDAETVFG